MVNEEKQLKADLNIFLTIVFTLTIIGLLFIYSSSSVYALEKLHSAHYFLKKQTIGVLIGLIGLLFFRFFPTKLIYQFTPIFFGGTLFLTALTLIGPFALKIHGSSRWLKLGNITFQPSELLKIAFIFYVSRLLTKKTFTSPSLIKKYLPYIIAALPILLLLQQPDFGMSVTLSTTACMLFFILHGSLKQLLAITATAIPIVASLIYFKPYRWKRIVTFLNPWQDPTGAGFQIIQSLIAIGSGSMWGQGVSHSKQKFFYLPMQHTDFIFSIIAEETGFFGSTLLISLYIFFLYFGMKIAWKIKDSFCMLSSLGFVLLINLQAIINLAVATGLFPTKGIGLPFVSYGNSSLISCLCMIGFIANCVHNNREIT